MNPLPLPVITHRPRVGRRVRSCARSPPCQQERWRQRGCAGRAWRSVGSEPTQEQPGAAAGLGRDVPAVPSTRAPGAARLSEDGHTRQ